VIVYYCSGCRGLYEFNGTQQDADRIERAGIFKCKNALGYYLYDNDSCNGVHDDKNVAEVIAQDELEADNWLKEILG
jgi:hypothetical protein